MMRVPYLWLFVTGLSNARVSVDVFYLPISRFPFCWRFGYNFTFLCCASKFLTCNQCMQLSGVVLKSC